jgi:hypothetical protein
VAGHSRNRRDARVTATDVHAAATHGDRCEVRDWQRANELLSIRAVRLRLYLYAAIAFISAIITGYGAATEPLEVRAAIMIFLGALMNALIAVRAFIDQTAGHSPAPRP